MEERTISVADLSGEELERIASTLRQSDPPLRLRLGGAYTVSDKLSLSADFVERFGARLNTRWDRTLSAGGEFRPVIFLPLRLGLATDFQRFAYTGGIGIYGGPFHVDLAAGRWGVLGGDGFVAALSVGFWPGSEF